MKIASLIVLSIMFFLISCNGNKSLESTHTTSTKIEESSVEDGIENDRFTIGWSVNNLSREFYQSIEAGVLAKANELGIDVITHDQKGSTAEMISGATDLIEQGIDALVIAPVAPEAMIIVSNLAREARIPLVTLDTGYNGADIDAFIVSDSFGGGILAGEHALNLIAQHSLTSKNVAIITVEEKFIYARRRGEGFKRVMNESGYNVVAEIPGNSNTVDGYEAMKEILVEYGDDLALVFAENDLMALGAAQAIDEAGKKGQIMVIGFDADPAAIKAIKEGLMQGTIAQKSFEMGELGVEVAYLLLTGGPVSYDDKLNKEIYVEVYLIDETGEGIQQ